jgi:hypothetical protein
LNSRFAQISVLVMLQSINTPRSRTLNWFQRYASQMGLVLILLVWTPLLTIHTLNIQHSDRPLIKSRPEFASPRPNKPHPSSPKPPDSRSQTPENKPDGKSALKQINEYPLPVGLAIGLVGAGIAVLFGAPILVVTGIGAAVSIAGSYILSH